MGIPDKMKASFGFFFLFGLALANPNPRLGKDPTIQEFEQEFHKLYTPEEEAEAEKNLKAHEEAIDKENELFAQGQADFQEAVMEWDDLSPEEFLAEKTGALDVAYGFGLLEEPEEMRINKPEHDRWLERQRDECKGWKLPKFFDARKNGVITSVKNQKSCGSCSAFATMAMVETCLINTGAPKANMDLSEQQLVDCAYDNKRALGCEGAYISAYPDWLEKTNGFVNHENHYPYLNNKPNLKCQNVKPWKAGARVNESITNYGGTDEDLKCLVYKYGAVVSVIYAGDQGFMDYRAGTVFNTCSKKSINHAITVIGWGKTGNGQEYWLIKNSWGDYWGDNGYIKVKKGTCGVGSQTVVTTCYPAGHQNPPPEKKGGIDITPCNISAKYGPKVTGTYNIKYKLPNGKTRTTTVTCAHSSCTPENGNAKNACFTICGRSKCGSK